MPPEYHSRDELEAHANVKGTALGADGELIVFVTRKRPESQLAASDIVPSQVTLDDETYDTDVVSIGIPHLTRTVSETNTTPDAHRARHRPIPGGVSIGNPNIGAGTMGSPLLYHESEPVVLTNAHVAAGADQHTQPSSLDGGDGETIATLKEESALDPDETQTTDSALLRVDEETVSKHVLGIGPLVAIDEANRSQTFTKAGRTTGVTEGELLGTDARLNVAYGPDTIRFAGCDVFTDMSEPGDSGSLIGYTTPAGLVATDLLFAGSSMATIGIPLRAGVFKEHGPLEIPSQDPDEGDNGEDDDTGNSDGSDDSSDGSDDSSGGAGDDSGNGSGDENHAPERSFEDYVEALLIDEYGPENVERQYFLSYSGRYVDLVAFDPENERVWAFELENDKGSVLNGSGQARFYATSLTYEDPSRGSAIPVLCVPAGHIDPEERSIIELSGVTVREIETPEDVSLDGV